MFLKSIHLKNFRNLRRASLEPSRRFNLIVGSNAQGKTNVLESIYFLARGDSFRNSEFRDAIHWGEEFADVDAHVSGLNGDDKLSLFIGRTGKKFLRNEKSSRIGGKGKFGVVAFAPEEILLIKEAPAARRKYIDNLITQVKPAHSSLVKNYSKVVAQRNRLLQAENLTEKEKIKLLKPWDEQLSRVGSYVFMERDLWCGEMNAIIPEKYSQVAPNDGTAIFEYNPHCTASVIKEGRASVAAWIVDELEKRKKDEITRGTTLVGPHRDDFIGKIEERAISSFGSQGQHRTFVLSIKISEIDFIRKHNGESPVLLFDDVTSELDDERIKYLFKYMKEVDCQTFITTTKESETRILPKGECFVFDVKDGTVNARKSNNAAVCKA